MNDDIDFLGSDDTQSEMTNERRNTKIERFFGLFKDVRRIFSIILKSVCKFISMTFKFEVLL